MSMQVVSNKKNKSNDSLSCVLLGIGAWGPGFCSWQELAAMLLDKNQSSAYFSKPKPAIIPANEQRRAPIAVRMAVETSWQAIQSSNVATKETACVFGSGIGDSEVSDYLCKVLATEQKQLSPTRFHNSVHNAAAGYWTISTGCMKSANSIAAYYCTVGMALFEAVVQANIQREPVLVTLFDTQTFGLHSELHKNQFNFSLSFVLTPFLDQIESNNIVLTLQCQNNTDHNQVPINQEKLSPDGKGNLLINTNLQPLFDDNPAARILKMMEHVGKLQNGSERMGNTVLELNPKNTMAVTLERT